MESSSKNKNYQKCAKQEKLTKCQKYFILYDRINFSLVFQMHI
jgi:hypothetical protein